MEASETRDWQFSLIFMIYTDPYLLSYPEQQSLTTLATLAFLAHKTSL